MGASIRTGSPWQSPMGNRRLTCQMSADSASSTWRRAPAAEAFCRSETRRATRWWVRDLSRPGSALSVHSRPEILAPDCSDWLARSFAVWDAGPNDEGADALG